MADEVTPAMTAEEWAEVRDDPTWWSDRMQEAAYTASQHLMTYLDGPYRHHALAALALHGQTFGFSREDVQDIIAAAGHLNSPFPEFCSRLRTIAARIEALLPPESV